MSLWRDSWLPPLRLDVVHVRMLADLDRRDGAADVDAVLDHRVLVGQLLDRQLVADGDVALRAHLDFLVLVHDPAGELLAGLNAFDYDHADRIVLVMHYKVNHAFASLTRFKCSNPRCRRPLAIAAGRIPTPR